MAISYPSRKLIQRTYDQVQRQLAHILVDRRKTTSHKKGVDRGQPVMSVFWKEEWEGGNQTMEGPRCQNEPCVTQQALELVT